jgi:hypothetical protein
LRTTSVLSRTRRYLRCRVTGVERCGEAKIVVTSRVTGAANESIDLAVNDVDSENPVLDDNDAHSASEDGVGDIEPPLHSEDDAPYSEVDDVVYITDVYIFRDAVVTIQYKINRYLML